MTYLLDNNMIDKISQTPPDTAPHVSIILPTRNERDNIIPLIEKLIFVLKDVAWEAIFVDDDSLDGTVDIIRECCRYNLRIRLIHRIGRRGLSSACIEGIQASTAPMIAVMDADLQHDKSLLPMMLSVLKKGEADLVIGSRYVPGGDVAAWDKTRAGMSDFATWLGQVVLKVKVADPMSGFFMMTRPAFDRSVRQVSALGFKILIDLIASAEKPLIIKELPYSFRPRIAGESKLDALVAWEYIMLLIDKTVGEFFPVRFVLFSLVGLFGLMMHLLILTVGFIFLKIEFYSAQLLATYAAMVINYSLNNFMTYRDRRLTGWHYWRGLLSFSFICSVGAVPSIGVAGFMFGPQQSSWWVAGLAGAIMSLVWNYTVSSIVTWKK